VFTIFAGSAIGAVAGAAVAFYTRKGRKMAIPFGPFLSIGALLFLFKGPEIINWYIALMR
ncbi:MAG: prepilin peptidase, partial [Deltaproteobacteria bacterium]